ncbi:hypothetical protein [Taibaiella koreensis]|uniref:hypothetical protein n=1 Tax=Taibaiella koreensis TaxID=1268548 RepID=UPI000E59C6BD|nr:hypothetical protein [Taibaiella koreensis]
MEHFFELPVNHNGEELLLKGRLVTFAYTYKFYVMVNGRELVFERDDSGEFRALVQAVDSGSEIDASFIHNIIVVLEAVQPA